MYIILVASPSPSYIYFITEQFIQLKNDNERIY